MSAKRRTTRHRNDEVGDEPILQHRHTFKQRAQRPRNDQRQRIDDRQRKQKLLVRLRMLLAGWRHEPELEAGDRVDLLGTLEQRLDLVDELPSHIGPEPVFGVFRHRASP
ncbi:MAG: hypothetical protein E6H79_14255 [Betaproteobacteria bacterium]|nr:MAG: hypothetical protein E6H79_14255 [Betaproteobacteria bacterium]